MSENGIVSLQASTTNDPNVLENNQVKLRVVNTPYPWGKRKLPRGRHLDGDIVDWLPETISWWTGVSRMPHCVVWEDSDWNFAIATAYVLDDALRGNARLFAEVRQREFSMGVTIEARRKLGIEYVDPSEVKSVESTPVVVISSDRRQKILGG